MAKRELKGKSARKGPSPRNAVPVGMLALLFVAFGGALTMKAFEERQSADNAMLIQQTREAEAMAGNIRAELIVSRGRMEGLLLAGASPEAIRRDAPFEAVSERDPPEGAWTQLADRQGIRIFAQNRAGKWIAGLRISATLLPEATGGRTLYLAPGSAATKAAYYETLDGARTAIACAPVATAGVAACIVRPAPLISMADLNRILIYGLLVAAPMLAVFGLLQTIRRQRDALGDEARRAISAGKEAADSNWRQFEVSGMIGLWRWSPRTQLLNLGQVAAQLLGANRSGEMTLDEFSSLIIEEDRSRVCTSLEQADPLVQISAAFQGAGRSLDKYFEMIGGPADGDVSGAILNVTDRIQAQNRSRRAEALARTALDAHPGPFAVWDSRKRLTHWNAAFPRQFNLDQAVIHAGASYDFVMAEVSKFVRIERPLGDDTNARETLLLSDQWIRLVDRRTASDGLITVGLDITSMKRQEATLMRSERRLRTMVTELERTRGQAQELSQKYAEQKDRAERALQAKTSFLQNISHELRTPLNHINGFSEMMTREICGPLGDPRYKEYAEAILESGQHLLDIINDILDTAKIEAGKMQIVQHPIDATDAVDAAVRLIRRRAADKQVSLVFDPDDDLPNINGDHRAIKQMTLNLITNSLKFTAEGGEIRVTMVVEDAWLVIRVADTGIGISPADLPRIGQPFEQVRYPDGRQHKGTGLGLALTKSFAEMHGGHLMIDSELGVGTTVTIYLPIPAAEAPLSTSSARVAAR